MSDFAKAQMMKFGWSEGKGLGKNENGITQAIRPKLKFDTSGVGHTDSEHQWWSSVYNKAANNIVLDKSLDSISISVADKDAVNISSKQHTVPEKASLYHGNFLKTSTLQDGNLIKDNTCQTLEDKEEATVDPFSKMTDEDLFKACGGRTAHKGARHGLTLSGKLSRIAEQDRLAGLKSCNKCTKSEEREKKKIKKYMEESNMTPLDAEENDDVILPVPPVFSDENYKPNRKTIKRQKRKVQDLAHQLTKTCMIQDDVKEDEENSPQDTSEDSSRRINKKKKKAKRKRDQTPDTFDSDTSAACFLDNDVSMKPNNKKSKKSVTSSTSVKKNSCDAADPTHMCEKCEFYDYHQKAYEKHNKRFQMEKKKYKKNKYKPMTEADKEAFSMSRREYKRKGKKNRGSNSTAVEASKLNGRISKRKNKKLENKKKRILILPATLKLEETTVKVAQEVLPGGKIGN